MAQVLFANQRETNLASTVALVEESLTELGYQPPETSRVDAQGALARVAGRRRARRSR